MKDHINRRALRWGRTSMPFGIEFIKTTGMWRVIKEKKKKTKIKDYNTQEKAIEERDKL